MSLQSQNYDADEVQQSWKYGGLSETEQTAGALQFGQRLAKWRDLIEYRLQKLREADGDSLNAVVICDWGDADGGTCAALWEHFQGDKKIVLPTAHADYAPASMTQLLSDVALSIPEGVELHINDLGPNDPEQWRNTLGAIMETNPVHVRDHHDVPDSLIEFINSDPQSTYVHTTDEQKSSSRLVYQCEFGESGPEYIDQLVRWADIRDNYLDDHPEFEAAGKIVTYCYQFPFHHFQKAAARYGTELEKADFGGDIETFQQVREQKIQHLLDHSESREVAGETVAFGYGNVYQSKAGHKLLQKHDATIALIVQPSMKISFRGVDEGPNLAQFASELGGGGRDNAAGVGGAEMKKNLPNLAERTHNETLGSRVFDFVEQTIEQVMAEPSPEMASNE